MEKEWGKNSYNFSVIGIFVVCTILIHMIFSMLSIVSKEAELSRVMRFDF